MNLFKSKEGEALRLLASLVREVSGLRLALEHLALKQGASPLPDFPDDSAFLAQTDEDFALLETLSKQREVSDEVDLLAEAEGLEVEPIPEPPRPAPGSFAPRFQR